MSSYFIEYILKFWFENLRYYTAFAGLIDGSLVLWGELHKT